jgi:hypothetical protein
MSQKTHANVAVRLPKEVLSRLEQMRKDKGARSIASVVDHLAVTALDRSDEIELRRQPLTAERRNLFLRAETVERLRFMALDHATEVGSILYSLIADDQPVRASRPVRSSGETIHAQAA